MPTLAKWIKPAGVVGFAAGLVLVAGAYAGGWRATSLLAAATAPTLGAAGSFAVLAAAGVTNTGPTTVTGDLGTHPTAAVTGFFGSTANDGPGTVNGQIHQADGIAGSARTALTTAYTNAFGQATDFAIGTELGGQTLVAGVYASPTFGITAGAGFLTLSGSASDVWIFKSDATLITGAGSEVRFVGGAQACNVYWQVGSSATLGASSTFQGTILANTSISVGNSATVVGRLLAGAMAPSGAVTLDNNTIAIPTCAAPPATPTATNVPATATALAATPTATVPATATAPAATATVIAATPTTAPPAATATTVAAATATATATAVAVAPTETPTAPPAVVTAPADSGTAEASVAATPATITVPAALPRTGERLPWGGPLALLFGTFLLAAGFLAARRARA